MKMSDEKYVVVKNGKPQTGPLTFPTAQKAADEMGGHVEPAQSEPQAPPNYNDALWLVILVSAILGILAGFAFQSVAVGLGGAGGSFIVGMITALWTIKADKK
jgi:hypothetical protein